MYIFKCLTFDMRVDGLVERWREGQSHIMILLEYFLC